MKRKDESKLVADRHCQVYFLNKENDSVEKLTIKRLPFEAMIDTGSFILTQKQRNENSREWSEYNPDCECCQRRRQKDHGSPKRKMSILEQVDLDSTELSGQTNNRKSRKKKKKDVQVKTIPDSNPIQKDEPSYECAGCTKPHTPNHPLSICVACRSIHYCGADCQRKDWAK